MNRQKKQVWKKRLAAALAIVMVVLMVFSLAVPFLVYGAQVTAVEVVTTTGSGADEEVDPLDLEPSQQTEMGQDRFSADISVGFDGAYIVGKPLQLSGVVTNYGKDFDGEVEIKVYQYTGSGNMGAKYVMYYQPMELAQNAAQQFSFTTTMWTIRTYLEVTLVDQSGNTVFVKNFPVQALDPNTAAIAVLTENANALSYLNGLGMSGEGEAYDKVFFFDGQTFPTDEKVLENFRVLLIDDISTAALAQSQIDAITQWTKSGGVTILGTGPRAEAVLGGFSEDFAAFSVGQMRSVTQPDIFARFGMTSAESIPVADISAEGLQTVVSADGVPLVSEMQVDQGRLILQHFSLSVAPLSRMEQAAGALHELYDSVVGEDVFFVDINSSEYLYSEDPSQRFAYISGNFPALQTQGLQIMFALLVVYLILLGPVLYIVLRKKDRRERAWGIIPVMAVAFFAVTLLIGLKGYAKNGIAQYMGVVSLEEGVGTGFLEGGATLASPDKGSMNVQMQPDGILEIYNDNRESIYYNLDPLTANAQSVCEGRFSMDGLEIETADRASWEKTYFSFREKIDLGGGIELDIRLQDGTYVGEIRNNSNVSFEKVCLVLGDYLLETDPVAAGGSVAISVAPDFTATPVDAWEAVRNLTGGGFYSADNTVRQRMEAGEIDRTEAAIEMNMYDMLENQLNADWSQAWSGIFMPITFYGFTTDKPIEQTVLVNRDEVTEFYITMVKVGKMMDLTDQSEFDTGYTIAPYDMEVSTDAYDTYQNYRVPNIYLGSENPADITLHYQLGEVQNVDGISFMEYNYNNSPMNAEILLPESGTWQQAPEGEWLDPEIYADAAGEITLRMHLEGYTETAIPLMRLKGGE